MPDGKFGLGYLITTSAARMEQTQKKKSVFNPCQSVAKKNLKNLRNLRLTLHRPLGRLVDVELEDVRASIVANGVEV